MFVSYIVSHHELLIYIIQVLILLQLILGNNTLNSPDAKWQNTSAKQQNSLDYLNTITILFASTLKLIIDPKPLFVSDRISAGIKK